MITSFGRLVDSKSSSNIFGTVHIDTSNYFRFEVMKNENENCTILIPKGNTYCRRKSSAKGPRFKVLYEGLSTEIDILIRSPIQVVTLLLNPSVPGD